jgi:type IV pilus assembly protein PilV
MWLKNAARRQPSRRKLAGFMLIEVLVSIALSAVALLALASLNATALRYTKMSQYRALATHLASDLGERMRANKGGAAAEGFGEGDYDYSISFAGQAATVSAPAPSCNTALSVCSTQELADLDMAQWQFQVRRLLPEGSVFVLRQSDEVAADVWIAWRDPLVAKPDETPSLSNECAAGLAVSEPSIRCSYFRINL